MNDSRDRPVLKLQSHQLVEYAVMHRHIRHIPSSCPLPLVSRPQRPIHRNQQKERPLDERLNLFVRLEIERDVVCEPVACDVVEKLLDIGE